MPAWQKLKGWHDDAENSTGFGRKPTAPPTARATTPPADENKYYDDADVIAAAAECMPYYDAVLGRASPELEAAVASPRASVACAEPVDVPPPPPANASEVDVPPPPPANGNACEATAPMKASGGAPIASTTAAGLTASVPAPLEKAGSDAAR